MQTFTGGNCLIQKRSLAILLFALTSIAFAQSAPFEYPPDQLLNQIRPAGIRAHMQFLADEASNRPALSVHALHVVQVQAEAIEEIYQRHDRVVAQVLMVDDLVEPVHDQIGPVSDLENKAAARIEQLRHTLRDTG